MTVLTTARLRLREFALADAPFVLALVNEPAWLAGIGDRNVRSLPDAVAYLQNGPLRSYRENGFGLWAIERMSDGELVGMCGLLRRPELPDVDVGYALCERHHGHGYAREAAAAVLAHGRDRLGLRRIVAIVSPGNAASIRVLEDLGMQQEGTVRLRADAAETLLFSWSG